MNTVSRTISGVVAFALGLVVVVAVGRGHSGEGWWGLLWGLFLMGLGVYIFFNKKEDDIEKIKDNEK